MPKKRSFFEKLTGGIDAEEFQPDGDARHLTPKEVSSDQDVDTEEWQDDEPLEEGQLTVDVYQTPNEMVIRTMVAGVKPEDLDVTITREMVTIKGSRHQEDNVIDEDFFSRELYWGNFSRTILLPEEVAPDEAMATTKHGLLTIRIPKIDKNRANKVKVKNG